MFSQLNTSMDPLSFSHGQTQSKLWLCETMEPHLPQNAVVAILGCWYNMLGFMLITRNKQLLSACLGCRYRFRSDYKGLIRCVRGI